MKLAAEKAYSEEHTGIKPEPRAEEQPIHKHQFLVPRPGRVVIVNDMAVSQIGRIIVPDKAKRRPTSGKIVAIGDGVEGLSIGDRVVFPQFAGTLIGFKDMEAPYLVLSSEEIHAVVTDPTKQIDESVGTGYVE